MALDKQVSSGYIKGGYIHEFKVFLVTFTRTTQNQTSKNSGIDKSRTCEASSRTEKLWELNAARTRWVTFLRKWPLLGYVFSYEPIPMHRRKALAELTQWTIKKDHEVGEIVQFGRRCRGNRRVIGWEHNVWSMKFLRKLENLIVNSFEFTSSLSPLPLHNSSFPFFLRKGADLWIISGSEFSCVKSSCVETTENVQKNNMHDFSGFNENAHSGKSCYDHCPHFVLCLCGEHWINQYFPVSVDVD